MTDSDSRSHDRHQAMTKDEVDRREVVIGGTALAATAAVGLPLSAAADTSPDNLLIQPGDRLEIVTGALRKQRVRPELLETNARPFEAFPVDPAADVMRRKNRRNRLLILRLDPSEMNADTRARSVDGVLAYSALCTHRACTVKSWMPEPRNLRCHCHLSQFAALEAGRIKRGPAKRSLPMVPLGLDDDGYVVALDGFTSKPGAAKT